MPRLVGFDPRSPTEIEQTYSEIVLARSRRLALTLFLSVVTAVMVFIGLVVASVGSPPRFAAPPFQAALQHVDGGSVVSVTAYVGKASSAQLGLTPLANSTAVEDETTLTTVISTEKGLIQTSARLKVARDAVRVQLIWDAGDDVQVQLSRACVARDVKRAS